MKIIIYLCTLTCVSWLPRLSISGSELGWALVFELSLSYGMALGSPVGSPIRYYINIFLVLTLCNYIGIWEGYLVGVSLRTMSGSMIGTGEGSLVVLLLELPLGYPPYSPNHGSELHVMLLGAPIGLWFGSEAARCLCSC